MNDYEPCSARVIEGDKVICMYNGSCPYKLIENCLLAQYIRFREDREFRERVRQTESALIKLTEGRI